MQRNFAENEVSFKFSPPSSPISFPNSSGSVTSAVNFTIPLFPGIDVDDLLEEEKQSDNAIGERVIDETIDSGRFERSSSVQVPSMNSVTGSATDTFSLNFGQNNQNRGGVEETNNVQHVPRINQRFAVPALAAVPVRQSQPGGFFSRKTEVAPILPMMTNYLGTQPFGNHHKMHCFPYNNMHVSSASTPRMKRKIDACTNAFNSTEMDSLFDQIPSGASQDSVDHTSFVPVQAVFQNPFFPIAARGRPVNYSLTPFNLEATENQEMDFFATSRGSWNDNSLDGNASVPVPVNKRKEVRPRFSSSRSVSVVSDGNKNANSKPSAKHGFPLLHECNTLEATPIVRPSWFPMSSELYPGLLSSASSYRPEDDKEIKGKGLVLLVQKELRNTDVGNLGRIVLPKKDAEANLPPLDAKDGVILQMDDMIYSVEWKFKYRYWPNNKSRMYVMENTGDFVKTHNLQTGDHFIVYKEVSSGKYIVRGKKEARTLFLDDMMGQWDEKRSEDRETGAASRQVHSEQGNLVPSDGFVNIKAEQDVVATGVPFDFVGDSGRPSEFFPLSLPDIDPEGGL